MAYLERLNGRLVSGYNPLRRLKAKSIVAVVLLALSSVQRLVYVVNATRTLVSFRP